MKLLPEPLVHFLVAGMLLFTGYAWLHHSEVDTTDKAARVVRITANEIAWLTQTWTQQWRRPPTEDELKGLVAHDLKEELLSREARTLQLDIDDSAGTDRSESAREVVSAALDAIRAALRHWDNRHVLAHPAHCRFCELTIQSGVEGGG